MSSTVNFPNFQGKHDEEPLVTPEQYLEYMKSIGKFPTIRPPEGVILCYSPRLLSHALNSHKMSKADGCLSKMNLLDETGGRVGIIGNFGIGSPVAVVILEELIAFGVKKFISIGTAGGLQDDIEVGDIVVCDTAIRDEGTSHHYIPSSKYAHASKLLTENLQRSLRESGHSFRVGASWTIDSIYRETITEARHYKDEGVLTVDMEASAIFSVAAYRGVEVGAMFTISDSLASLKWEPNFHSHPTKNGLETLYRVAVRSLSAEA